MLHGILYILHLLQMQVITFILIYYTSHIFLSHRDHMIISEREAFDFVAYGRCFQFLLHPFVNSGKK